MVRRTAPWFLAAVMIFAFGRVIDPQSHAAERSRFLLTLNVSTTPLLDMARSGTQIIANATTDKRTNR